MSSRKRQFKPADRFPKFCQGSEKHTGLVIIRPSYAKSANNLGSLRTLKAHNSNLRSVEIKRPLSLKSQKENFQSAHPRDPTFKGLGEKCGS